MHVYAPSVWKARNRALREDRVVVLTGLSSKVCGVVLRVEQDEGARRASIKASLEPGAAAPSGVALVAVEASAALLAERARRTLGMSWTVLEWSAPKVLDLREKGSGW